jgi:two-component system response regulator AtoC
VTEKIQVLIVEDDNNMRFVLDECLKRKEYQTLLAADGEQAINLFKANCPDLVILDFKIPKINGMEVLESIVKINPDIVVIMLTGHATINLAVESMKKGAYDFLTKPFEVEELLRVVENAISKRKIIIENELAKNNVKELGIDNYYSAASPAIKKVNKMVQYVAGSDYTVLLEGESGTGKSLIAREIHERSNRKKEQFVIVDCGTLPSNLIESELFGYEKGAFTGALNRKIGRIERANGGTLFLDEISTLDFNSQAALLRVIQSKEFERIGGNEPLGVDVRIIAASNRDLKKMVEDKTFRHDLYYRLKVFTIVMPPLKERTEDIIPLAYFFINKYGNNRNITLAPEAAMKLKSFDWPGNIRELENAVKHALILVGEGNVIESKHLPLELDQGYWAFRDRKLSLREILERTEKSIIQQALLENDLNIEKCAKALRISKRTLYYRINKLGIDLCSQKQEYC